MDSACASASTQYFAWRGSPVAFATWQQQQQQQQFFLSHAVPSLRLVSCHRHCPTCKLQQNSSAPGASSAGLLDCSSSGSLKQTKQTKQRCNVGIDGIEQPKKPAASGLRQTAVQSQSYQRARLSWSEVERSRHSSLPKQKGGVQLQDSGRRSSPVRQRTAPFTCFLLLCTLKVYTSTRSQPTVSEKLTGSHQVVADRSKIRASSSVFGRESHGSGNICRRKHSGYCPA